MDPRKDIFDLSAQIDWLQLQAVFVLRFLWEVQGRTGDCLLDKIMIDGSWLHN